MKRVLILLCFISAQLAAQQSLNLQDAVNIALKNSLDIQLAKNDVQVNDVLNSYSVAGGLPVVNGSAASTESVPSVNQKLNTGTTIQRNAAATNNTSFGVSGSILLFNGYRVVATKNRLEELEKQSQQVLNLQIQNVIGGVMTGYYDIVRQQNYLKTINQSIDVAQQKLTIIETQQSVGLANNADLFQAQLDLNTLQQTKQSQLLVIDQAKTELLRLMTLKPDSAIAIQDTIIVDRDLKLDDILSKIPGNADVLAQQEQVRINELIAKETAALRYPSISATAGYNYSRNQTAAGNVLFNQNYGPNVGLSLSVPIYNGANKRRQRAAEIDTRSAEVQRQALLRDYNASVVKNYQGYVTTLQQLETEQKNFELAQQLLNLVFQRFQLRAATIVDFTLAQQSFEESAYRLVNLSFAAKAAEIELKRLANVLTF